MSSWYEDTPEWVKVATERKDVTDWDIVLGQRNFLAGAYMGHEGRIAAQDARIKELEAQLELAFEYQRALDAQLLETKSRGVWPQDIHSSGKRAGLLLGIELIRDQKIGE